MTEELLVFRLSSKHVCTIKPVYNDHPWDREKLLLFGGVVIQDLRKKQGMKFSHWSIEEQKCIFLYLVNLCFSSQFYSNFPIKLTKVVVQPDFFFTMGQI